MRKVDMARRAKPGEHCELSYITVESEHEVVKGWLWVKCYKAEGYFSSAMIGAR